MSLPKDGQGAEEGNENSEGNAEDGEGNLPDGAHGGGVEMECRNGASSMWARRPPI